MTEPATSPAVPDDVCILVGCAAEDADAYHRLWQELSDWYGIQGPIERRLLERVVSLTWRLQRVTRAERGMATERTVGEGYRRITKRIRTANRESFLTSMSPEGMAGSTESVTIRRACQALASLREMVATDDDGAWDAKQAHRIVFEVFGEDERKRHGVYSVGSRIDLYLTMHGLCRTGVAPDDMDGEVVQATLLSELNRAHEVMTGLAMSLEQEEEWRDHAAIETMGLPPESRLKGLVAYERHLEQALRQATADLERAIARRSLAVIARRCR